MFRSQTNKMKFSKMDGRRRKRWSNEARPLWQLYALSHICVVTIMCDTNSMAARPQHNRLELKMSSKLQIRGGRKGSRSIYAANQGRRRSLDQTTLRLMREKEKKGKENKIITKKSTEINRMIATCYIYDCKEIRKILML